MKHVTHSYLAVATLLLLLFSSPAAQAQNALAFDGTDDLVTTTGASSLIAGSNNISLTCWVYPTNPTPSTTSYDGLCGLRNNADADFYLLHYTATEVEARFRNSAGVAYDILGGNIQLNTWQHLAFTYDGSMLRYYHNGTYLDSMAASGNITSTVDDFFMGGLPFQVSVFNLAGKLDEVSLWSTTLSQAEINCIVNDAIDSTAAGLQLLYRLNQGVAGGNNTAITSATDATGHLNGTLMNFAMTGTTSNFVTGAANVNSSTASFCPGTDYIWGNDTLTAPGVYTQVYTSTFGCDSTVQLTLNSSVDTSVTRNNNMVFAHQTGIGTAYQWLDCNAGFAPIANATNQIYTPTANGSYAVKVTFGGCTDTSSCYTFTNVGIGEYYAAGGVSLSPNPSKDVCLISAPAFSNATLSVYDVTGKAVAQERFNKETILSLSQLTPGVYLVELKSKNGNLQRQKLVKQ